jgi:low temperature requirement protein LtrA
MTTASGETDRVSTLELFFDLVFVLTITQLTDVLYRAPTLRSLLEVVLMLALIWWMYGGYAWLTNAVSADRTNRRILLLGGMGSYFLLALTVPEAFSSNGLAFGLAYLAIVGIHTTLFTRAASQHVVHAILRISPLNILSALLVLAGGVVGGTAQYLLWAGAVVLQWLTPTILGLQGFEVGPAHFVERHGLVLIVAIGESVVAVGVGAAGLAVDGQLVLAALLGLALSACLWWLYFGQGDDEHAEHALAGMEPLARARRALTAFFYCYLAMLLGIVAIAAAEHAALEHPFDDLSWRQAVMLSGGAAVFLTGSALFRAQLAIGSAASRVCAALLVLAAIPLGAVSAVLQIAVLVGILGGTIAIDGRVSGRVMVHNARVR